jgi:hypothetical protein
VNDTITSAVRRLAARATGRITRWQQRLSGRLQAGDTFARQAGWTITRTRLGGRIYRDPRFGQLSVTRAPATPHLMDPPANGPPAGSSGSRTDTGYQAASGPVRTGKPERRNR